MHTPCSGHEAGKTVTPQLMGRRCTVWLSPALGEPQQSLVVSLSREHTTRRAGRQFISSDTQDMAPRGEQHRESTRDRRPPLTPSPELSSARCEETPQAGKIPGRLTGTESGQDSTCPQRRGEGSHRGIGQWTPKAHTSVQGKSALG